MEGRTLDEMMLLACTHMLYSALPTVRVRTEPALREVIATADGVSDSIISNSTN